MYRRPQSTPNLNTKREMALGRGTKYHFPNALCCISNASCVQTSFVSGRGEIGNRARRYVVLLRANFRWLIPPKFSQPQNGLAAFPALKTEMRAQQARAHIRVRPNTPIRSVWASSCTSTSSGIRPADDVFGQRTSRFSLELWTLIQSFVLVDQKHFPPKCVLFS